MSLICFGSVFGVLILANIVNESINKTLARSVRTNFKQYPKYKE